jgi:hypothetical protein
MFDIDVRPHINGYSLNHCTMLECALGGNRIVEVTVTSTSFSGECSGNVIRIDTYPHPKHTKVGRHLIYV